MSKLQVKWDTVISLSEIFPRPICRWINLGNGTMFRIAAFFTSPTFEDMPRFGLFVAIEKVGSYLFPITSPVGFQYVSEKLFIPDSDAKAMADWINTQTGNKFPQQGEYNRDYIRTIEEVNYAGEIPSYPLTPLIIGESE